MGLDFRIRDFFYPGPLLKLKHEFDRNQWLSESALVGLQEQRLAIILRQAYEQVPYYRQLFQKQGLTPRDIESCDQLARIPFLTKNILRGSFAALTAGNAPRYGARTVSTSGTTGGQVKFLIDRPANILEFVFYWRYWGWAGYRLGNRFAEFSAQHFVPYEGHKGEIARFEPLTRRLILNSLRLSEESVPAYAAALSKYRPLFLKGLPSNLYIFALIFSKHSGHGITFKAVFSQGENLLSYQKQLIEKVFSTKVFDHYGHMERTVAITQCPSGNWHVHMDYGIAEFEERPDVVCDGLASDEYVAEVIGTSLYTMSMPLIRYRTGDFVRLKRSPLRCLCGRQLSTIVSVIGRSADAVITPDRRAVTALYVALDRTPGITFGQIIQERIDRLVVRVACDARNRQEVTSALLGNIRSFVGEKMDVEVEYVSAAEMHQASAGKFKVVISHLSQGEIISAPAA